MEANSQTEANKRWQEKNKERAKYLSNRSRTRSFIRNQATLKDVKELKNLLKEREIKMKEAIKNLKGKYWNELTEDEQQYLLKNSSDWGSAVDMDNSTDEGIMDFFNEEDELDLSIGYKKIVNEYEEVEYEYVGKLYNSGEGIID